MHFETLSLHQDHITLEYIQPPTAALHCLLYNNN